jgi:DNA-binding transcriptional LysR family regulator
MNLDQLRYLVLLAEELNFTRAAERAHVAQPALSRQVRNLEDELGVPLVDRTTRRVQMTPAGVRIVERSRRILDEIDALRSVGEDAAALLAGRVAIGLTPTPGPFDAASALAGFHARHPEIELALTEELSVLLARRLQRDELDLAFVSAIPDRMRVGLEMHLLAAEPLRVVVSRRHRLAGRRSVRLSDVAAEPFISFPIGATIRETITAAALGAGFAPRVPFESNDTSRIRALVAHDLGVAVLPASDIARAGPDVAGLDIRGSRLVYEIFLAWRSDRWLAPAAAAFADAVRTGSLASGGSR